MKKLMFTVAVAAGLVAMGAGIESANTVGYQEKDLSLGVNDFVIQTFLPMNKTVSTTKLSDISVTDDWDPTSDYIATLLPTGNNDMDYTYLIAEFADALGGGEVAGWYKMEEVNDGDVSVSGPQDNVTLPFAEGFLAFNNSGAKLRFAGEVVAGDTELASALGMNAFSGNASPVDITLADLTVSDDWDPTSDYIATLQPTGNNDVDYTYLIADYAEALGGEPVAGWYKMEEVNDGDVSVSGPQNDVVISAGQALLIFQNSGATISLPSAL